MSSHSAVSGSVSARLLRLALVSLLLLTSGALPARSAPAATITLTSDTLVDSADLAYQACTSEPNDCSLRGAVFRSNADIADTYVLELPAGTYVATLAGVEDANYGGDLDVRGHLVIAGAGAAITVIDGGQIDRVLQVFLGASATVRDVTLTGGRASDGTLGSLRGHDGGGIHNTGTLIVERCVITGNAAGDGRAGDTGSNGGAGGEGGGVYSTTGSLTITDSIISENASGSGAIGGSAGASTSGTSGGIGGYGGGVSVHYGSATLSHTTIVTNTTGDGGPGNYGSSSGGDGGAGGNGGGLSVRYATVTVDASSISGNLTGDGGDGGVGGSFGGDGGPGGRGGGVYVQGTATLRGCTLSENTTGAGGFGAPLAGASYGLGGKGGDGGGLFVGFVTHLSGSIVTRNATGAGSNSGSTIAPIRSAAGAGGGLCVNGLDATVSITNTWITRNVLSSLGAGYGSGLCLSGAYARSASLWHTTFSDNVGGDGSAISLSTPKGTVALTNTIIVFQSVGITVTAGSTVTLDSTLWDVVGETTSGAGLILSNLRELAGGAHFVDPSSGDYHIGADSAAVDRGIAAGVLTDIDGETRPSGLGYDLGADELQVTFRYVHLPLVLRKQ